MMLNLVSERNHHRRRFWKSPSPELKEATMKMIQADNEFQLAEASLADWAARRAREQHQRERDRLISQVKVQIADGSYETSAKLEVAADKMLDAVLPEAEEPERFDGMS